MAVPSRAGSRCEGDHGRAHAGWCLADNDLVRKHGAGEVGGRGAIGLSIGRAQDLHGAFLPCLKIPPNCRKAWPNGKAAGSQGLGASSSVRYGEGIMRLKDDIGWLRRPGLIGWTRKTLKRR
jgi:hypothetical protein